jgi:hypothetical protein
MMDSKKARVQSLCPSARSDSEGGQAFGVAGGTVDAPKISYFKKAHPSLEFKSRVGSEIALEEVLRIAAPCEERGCQHFDGQDCRLVKRVVENLPIVAESLPPCAIRRDCRWWRQEGLPACLRCPQVVTHNYQPSEILQKTAVSKSTITRIQ